MNDQDKNDLSDPLVTDEEFQKLMDAADNMPISPADAQLLGRVQERLEGEIVQSANLSDDLNSVKFGMVWEDMKNISYKKFLAVAAVICLCVGVSVSLIMTPEENYEGVKGDDAIAIPLELSVHLKSEPGQPFTGNEIAPDHELTFSAYSDKNAFFSLIIFRNGARSVTTQPIQLSAGSEVVIKENKGGELTLRMQNPFDTFNICVLVADAKARLTSLLNTYTTMEGVKSAGFCREIKVVSS